MEKYRYHKMEMDAAPDGSPAQALGEIFIEGRERLVRMLSEANTVMIK